MITLALDTSTARGAVALLREEHALEELTFGRDDFFRAARTLLNRHAIEPTQIDLFAVGIGPGSFTGIRTGIATAQGLALPGRRPIIGVSSFDALALTVAPQAPADCPQLCLLADARRQEVYSALYDRDGRPARACRISPLEALADDIHDPLWFVSSEMEKFTPTLRELFGGFANVSEESLYPSAAAVGWLAVHRFREKNGRGDESIEPIYLRETQFKKLTD
jgi:tRNA threonylcarbamoyladenosine biosynthesis protein TsaB